MTIMRGDAVTIYITLNQGEDPLSPADLADMEVCIGAGLRRSYGDGGVGYDSERKQWYVRLTQEDTFALEGRRCGVVVRAKFCNDPEFDVRGMKVGTLDVADTISQEVL